jgi:hypothetical protein
VSRDLSAGGQVVLRATMSMIVFWTFVVVAAFFVGDAVVRGRWDVGLRVAGVVLFVAWALWVFLYRMGIVVDRDAVTARNVLRYTRIPWAHVADFDRRYHVRVILQDGTAVDCWGSPFPQRTASRRSRGSTMPGPGLNTGWRGITSDAPNTADSGVTAPDPTLQTLRALWGSAAPGSTGAVRRGWDVPALLIGAVCAVCALIAVLI